MMINKIKTKMKPNDIAEGIEIIDLALWLPKHKALVVSDFHIGYEDALAAQGVLIPKHQLNDTKERLKKIIANLNTKPKTIIITGDLKHEFGIVNREEMFGLKDLLRFLAKNCDKLIALKGNHDKILSFLQNEKLKIASKARIGDVLLTHGDSITDTSAKVVIVGHAHPAIKLSDGITTEKAKCFLKGKWKNKTIIFLPSFNLVVEGTDVLSEKEMSPYTKQTKNIEIWAIPEFNEVLYFGKLGSLERAIKLSH